jgi:hypothetical protein
MKDKISNILAVLWFFGVLMWTILFMIIVILMIFFADILGMLKSGFSTPTIGFVYCFLSGIVFAVTGWVPAFRKCYHKLPWLYPLSIILTMHLLILSIAEVILAKGFQVINTPRHTIVIVIVIIQMILCRVAMCIYLKKKPLIMKKNDLE